MKMMISSTSNKFLFIYVAAAPFVLLLFGGCGDQIVKPATAILNCLTQPNMFKGGKVGGPPPPPQSLGLYAPQMGERMNWYPQQAPYGGHNPMR